MTLSGSVCAAKFVLMRCELLFSTMSLKAESREHMSNEWRKKNQTSEYVCNYHEVWHKASHWRLRCTIFQFKYSFGATLSHCHIEISLHRLRFNGSIFHTNTNSTELSMLQERSTNKRQWTKSCTQFHFCRWFHLITLYQCVYTLGTTTTLHTQLIIRYSIHFACI